MRKTDTTISRFRVTELAFDSLQDFSEQITKEYADSSLYFFGERLSRAKELLAKGWPEGRKKLEQFRGKLENIMSREIVKQEIVYDVAGLDFDMGMVMEGQPECWYDFSPKEEQRIVRMIYSVTSTCTVTSEQLTLRGAGITALIDLLEANNVRVELDVIFSAGYNGINYHGKIPVKSAGQQLDLDRVCFVMMNPAMPRQLVFSLYESVNGAHDDHIPHCKVEHDTSDYDIAIGVAFGWDAAFTNINTTLEWIKSKLTEFGVHLEEKN